MYSAWWMWLCVIPVKGSEMSWWWRSIWHDKFATHWAWGVDWCWTTKEEISPPSPRHVFWHRGSKLFFSRRHCEWIYSVREYHQSPAITLKQWIVILGSQTVHFSIAVTIGIRLSGGSCFPGIRRAGFLSLWRANLREAQQTDKEPRAALLPESEQEVLWHLTVTKTGLLVLLVHTILCCVFSVTFVVFAAICVVYVDCVWSRPSGCYQQSDKCVWIFSTETWTETEKLKNIKLKLKLES